MNRMITRRTTLLGLAASTCLVSACQPSRPKLDAQIIIMGAGLAGLYAAMLLEDEGLDVLVVEALPRVGGRMQTLDHGDGITEGGGQQIGANYARILDVAQTLNVPLYSSAGRGPATSHYLNGDWQSGPVSVPQFPAGFQSTPPGAVLLRLLAAEPGFDAPESWLDAAPEFDISARQFLTERGFSSEAQALIERALNANNLETYSMINLHRTWQLYQQSGGMGASQYVEGGSQKLPEAMAASLSRPVKTGTHVRAIAVDAQGCTLTADEETLRAEQVICTLPLPALQKISGIQDMASPALKDAMNTLPYTQILQIHMRGTQPFWEQDNLGPSMWTDTPLERIFADSGPDGQLTGFHRAWINGDGVAEWTAMGQAAAQAAFTDRLTALRPSTEGALSPVAWVDWTRSNPHAGGAYYHWKPGQAGRLARSMGESIGNLHFAGEHLGLLHTGMEAAMESAERAAIRILEGVA